MIGDGHSSDYCLYILMRNLEMETMSIGPLASIGGDVASGSTTD